MSSIHGHEVLQMMLASGECWTAASFIIIVLPKPSFYFMTLALNIY